MAADVGSSLMFGRVDQVKIREVLDGWDVLQRRVLELEIELIKDPLEKIAARNKGKLNGSSKSTQD